MKQFYKRSLFILFSMVFCHLTCDAQVVSIRGVIREEASGETIPGASIRVKDGKITTISDIDGKFNLNGLKPSDALIITYIGYSDKTVPISQAKNGVLNISLSISSTRLEEVVVNVGYGQQRKSELTGSIGIIGADQMDKFSGGSVITSLQGKIAGLQVTTISGEPGAGASITLRGLSSINGASEPLIIIDGVPVNNDPYTAPIDNAGFSPLNDLNPSDIESIEVLKDAASASIYGSRASNGVILITTKRGVSTKAQFNVSLNSSMVNITRTIGVLNGPEFRSAYTDAIVNATGNYTTQIPLIDSLHPYYRNSIDWQNLAYQNTLQYKADLSVSGASVDKSMDYYISGSYRNLNPVVVGTNYTQASGSAKVNYKLNKTISGSSNLNVSNNNYSRQNSNIIGTYIRLFPVYNPYDPYTGDLVVTYPGGRLNPLAVAEYSTNDIDRTRYLLTQNLSFKITKGLEFKTKASYDYSFTESQYNVPPKLLVGSNSAPGGSYSPSKNTSFVNENTLNYTKTINKNHNINLLLGESYQEFDTKYLYLYGINPIDNTITTVGGYTTLSSFSQTESQYALASLFGRANYNYKYKYIFSGVLRADASSRFGSNNRTAYFPSISGAWRFTKENYFKNKSKWLSDGKLRVGYGITGNQNIGNYSSQGIYAKAGTYGLDYGITNTTLPNKDLKWERTKQFDTGVDLSFLESRINLTADFYIKNSYDLLFNVQIPSQTGYGSIPYNFGSLTNKGIDLELSGIILDKALSWKSTFTFGLNRNKVTSLPNNEDYNPNGYSLARVGQPVGVFYGYRSLGVYAKDADNVYKTNPDGSVIPYRKGSSNGPIYKGGDSIFQDVNGDGIIGLEDQQIIGDPTPDFFGGFQNTFNYKNFNFSFFINYVVGNDIYNKLRKDTDGGIYDTNYTTDVLRRWRQQGDVTDVPKLVKGDPMENNAISTHFIEDGSFIRLQNISLSYKLPSKTIKKFGFSAINLGLSVQNLLTFGTYQGYDPEVSSGNTALSFGVDNGAFPRTTSYNATLNLKF
ncbi:TonB-dependent receptor [Pedobacter sp. SD-b]|uniref:TonB-dependent receptor n=1 Tax=Pedobacter segetis TaxID=2793069 RepID=A0ABS1BMP5_9SPHI|nr:TonB-dependent receptor [Pedobacter segetis]MBK0383576.1 TonB-dependent receptor [Pedobacter segetis]